MVQVEQGWYRGVVQIEQAAGWSCDTDTPALASLVHLNAHRRASNKSAPKHRTRRAEEMPNARNGQIPRGMRVGVRSVFPDGEPDETIAWKELFFEKSFGEVQGHVHGQVSAKSRAIEGKSRALSRRSDLARTSLLTLV